MWKEKLFGKRFVVFSLLLVLVLGQLAAWPTWLTGEPQGEQALRKELELEREKTQSLTEYTAKLEILLGEYEKDSRTLEGKLVASQKRSAELEMSLQEVWASYEKASQELVASEKNLKELQVSLQASLSEAEKLRLLSNLSETDAKKKVGEIAVLSSDLEISEGERYELVSKQLKSWGGLVGAGVIYDPWANELGVRIDMGVRYKNVALVSGVEFRPSTWDLLNLSHSDLAFSAGLQWQF